MEVQAQVSTSAIGKHGELQQQPAPSGIRIGLLCGTGSSGCITSSDRWLHQPEHGMCITASAGVQQQTTHACLPLVTLAS